MDLRELRPQESSFKLRAAKRSFTLNPITLADEVWLDEQYGSEMIQEIFLSTNIKEISRIVYRLLKVEDKQFFKTRPVTFIDEEGNEAEIQLGGVELLRYMVSGNDEKLELINALIENIGLSRPDAEEDSKKKATK